MVLQKYKTVYVTLDIEFIILGLFLQVMNVDSIKLITKNFK